MAIILVVVLVIGAGMVMATTDTNEKVKLTVTNTGSEALTVSICALNAVQYDNYFVQGQRGGENIIMFTVEPGETHVEELSSKTVTVSGVYGAFTCLIGQGDNLRNFAPDDITGPLQAGDNIHISVGNSGILTPVHVERAGA